MLKYILPAALAASSLPIGAAEAARCPARQIYRVSMKVCAPRAKNLQFLSGRSKLASASVKDTARVDFRKSRAPAAQTGNEDFNREIEMNRSSAETLSVDPTQPEENVSAYSQTSRSPDFMSLRSAPQQSANNPFGALAPFAASR